MTLPETVKLDEIAVEDRLRVEVGELDTLCNSIKEFGLIEPIILAKDGAKPRLIAGGRRLLAVKRLGWTELQHGRHFLYRDEEYTDDPKTRHFFAAMELEENLRRKELTWQEEVLGKQRLLKTMQEIYGTAKLGGPTRAEAQGAVTPGFGINKLAAMLGESQGQTSKDLTVARYMELVPSLAKAETKEGAFRQLKILGAIIEMKNNAKPAVSGEKPWTLYEGDFRDSIALVSDSSVDLVYTDLPFGVDLSQMSKHATGPVSYSDSRESIVRLLDEVASQAYRILRDDRYAVFFFGFNYYTELLASLRAAGFSPNPVPIVWYKRTRSTENPNTRYANAYDPAIVAVKGSPVFIRPGQDNVIEIPAMTPGEKMQIAQQPVELVERFILDMTAEDATIADLMCGSGTTGIAAVKNKRKVILFEKEPAAIAIAKARLESL